MDYIPRQYRDRSIEKSQQLEKENDEKKEKLDDIIKKEKNSTFALQKCMKEQQIISKQLEAAEIEVKIITFIIL